MQPKKEANRYFGGADIFVFPSITETQGIVITEAMAAGIPAVAVGIMGPSDIIRDGVDGFLTPLKTDQFTAKINELLDNKELFLRSGESLDIPQGTLHRIMNPGTDNMIFIEIATGDYFDEDDIERIEDDYGRV
jgi:glycosyltransferase involved in cell wall biosynthesis